jgi:cytochrome c oxidase assembly protein subunit 19
MANRRTR